MTPEDIRKLGPKQNKLGESVPQMTIEHVLMREFVAQFAEMNINLKKIAENNRPSLFKRTFGSDF